MLGKRIIIVDDNAMFLVLAGRTLEQANHTVQVIAPASVFDVLKLCMEFKPDLAIIDYHMPRCNPETLALILKEDPAFQPLKVLGISTTRDQEVVTRMLQAGVDAFTFKGPMASLVQAVDNILAY